MRGTPLGGSTVLITGGGSGIGRRMAIGAARRGANVVIWDISTERGEAVRDEIRAHRLPCEAHTVDVTDKAAVRAAAEATGPVDVLVNNAGVVSGRPLLETSDAAIERTMAVNVLALYWVTRAFLPGMVERRRGTVVTVASAAGLVGVARQTDYSASKWAAVGFTESLRAELRTGRTGVRTLVVCPYFIDTGMFEGVQSRFPWLLPILKEGDVARAILDGVESGKQQLVLPRLVGLVPPARMLPVRAFDAFCDVMGINQTMAHFTGRPGDVIGGPTAPE
jgi:all-trans-retinol dehydrogenase (NAD+)